MTLKDPVSTTDEIFWRDPSNQQLAYAQSGPAEPIVGTVAVERLNRTTTTKYENQTQVTERKARSEELCSQQTGTSPWSSVGSWDKFN